MTKLYEFTQSEEMFEKAQNLIPGGAQASNRPYLPGPFPNYMQKGKGAHIWDVDGNEYIDYLLGYGPIILGHAYPRVNEAVKKQLDEGMQLSRSHPVQNQLAEKLISLIPCAEMVHFFKTGSCVTTAAVRIARNYTNRDKVIKCGYHGWHDWCTTGKGIPEKVTQLTFSFEYNDLEMVERIFQENKDQIACLIMEPMVTIPPQPGFLESIQKLTKQNGAVLIFDEVKTGFRFALGGAEEYANIIPDMAVFSKGMANGFPIAAVVGKKEIMQTSIDVHLSATFNVEILSMVASLATIQELEEKRGLEHIWKMGERLRSGLNQIIKEMDLEADDEGYPPMQWVRFRYQDEEKRTRVQETFTRESIRRGIFYPHHPWFISLSHSQKDIDKTLEVSQEAFGLAKKAL